MAYTLVYKPKPTRSRGGNSHPDAGGQRQVDPRSRGGNLSHQVLDVGVAGRSPLARGKRAEPNALASLDGSIPARAGETNIQLWCAVPCRVDPRSRGGNASMSLSVVPFGGRSPLARGKPENDASRPRLPGSIPARAGETSRTIAICCVSRVDPRSRGGNLAHAPAGAERMGRSPLARGKHEIQTSMGPKIGSIPARAGER